MDKGEYNVTHKRFVLFGFCFLLFPIAQAGTAYKWIDSSGNIQYSQTPPPKNAKLAKTLAVADAKYSYVHTINNSETNPDSKHAQALNDAQQAHRDAVQAAANSATDVSYDAAANAANRASEEASKAADSSSQQTRREIASKSSHR
jgi:hypothetical protein